MGARYPDLCRRMCSRQFPKHPSGWAGGSDPFLGGTLAGSLSIDSRLVGTGAGQPSPESKLPGSQQPFFWLELCAKLSWSRTKPSALPFACLSFPGGLGGVGRCGLPRTTSGKGERSAPGPYLAAAPRLLRGSMPTRPSYSRPGTTCATARNGPERPECQLPPHPVGSAGPVATAGRARSLEGGTPLRQKPGAHPQVLPKVWGPPTGARNPPGPVRGCGASVAGESASGGLVAGGSFDPAGAPFQPTLPPSS